jgi:FAD/FMN-containing dehydrogenase
MLHLRRPALEKNTVGYQPLHDLVDWFVGSEGTLGIVVEAELALLPRPAVELGLAIPFLREQSALAFIVAVRDSVHVAPRCIEYFDGAALDLVRAALGEPGWAPTAGAMVYVEEVGEHANDLDAWLQLGALYKAIDDGIKVFDGDAALREARRLRHAVPAGMHERAAPFGAGGGRRISTDWAVPNRRVAEAVARSREHCEATGVEPGVTYGHAGNGHPHQNWVGRNPDHVRRIEHAVEATLRDVISMGGTVAAEHGIGKLKARWINMQVSPEQVALMRAAKRELDPAGMLAPGNILE